MPDSASKTLADYKAPYPEPTEDQKRCVIFLDEKENENGFKIELIPGRVTTVDGVNNYFMGGSMTEETIKGWGYTYFVVELGVCGQTLMALCDDEPSKEQFVSMEPKFIGYNSRLPVVVLIPKDAELHYRIWTPLPNTCQTPPVLEL